MEPIGLVSDTAFQQAIDSINQPTKLVVCGARENWDSIKENLEFSTEDSEEIMSSSQTLDLADWFKNKRLVFEEDWEVDLSDRLGDWRGEAREKMGFTLAHDVLSGKSIPDLIGARIEAQNAWEIPAYFKYGGWNDCPSSMEHCAIWAYWEEKYGAKIVGISSDTIEAYVANPPKTKDDAIALAWEQYLYCYDIVDQGVETISNLAGTLMNHSNWYFWWD